MPSTDLHTDPFLRNWAKTMVDIWTDRMALLQVHRTGALRSSLRLSSLTLSPTHAAASFTFLKYGVYIDAGRGRGQQHPQARENATASLKSSKNRIPRPWLSPSWRISIRVLQNWLTTQHDQALRQTIAALATTK